MGCNVGSMDRMARVVVGSVLIAWALSSGNIYGWIGVVPLLTGIFKFCPVYTLLGLKTCGIDKKDS